MSVSALEFSANAIMVSVMDAKQIVEDLASRAQAAGMSLAEACRRANVAQSTPSRWRAGRYEPRMKVLNRLNRAIDDEVERRRAQVIDDEIARRDAARTEPAAAQAG